MACSPENEHLLKMYLQSRRVCDQLPLAFHYIFTNLNVLELFGQPLFFLIVRSTIFSHIMSKRKGKPVEKYHVAASSPGSSVKPETHCTIFGCPRRKIGIVKQSWTFLWSWLLIGALMSFSERGSKMAVVTVFRPKKAYDTTWSSHSVFAGMIHVYWPTNKNATWNQRNMALKHKTA